MDFLPKKYEMPKNEGAYYKFKKGENRFRIMSPAVVGFEYWTKDKKPVRAIEPWDEAPEDAKVDSKTGRFQKHFWAYVVWNYDAKKLQIMELTQSTIMSAIEALVENKKWGDPSKYDICVNRTGDTMEDTEYSVVPEPHSEAPAADASGINLDALFLGEDPFTSKSKVSPRNEDPFKDSPFGDGDIGPSKGENGDYSGMD